LANINKQEHLHRRAGVLSLHGKKQQATGLS